MTIQAIKLGRERYVIVREKDFRQLTTKLAKAESQDAGDIAESTRRMREPSGISLAQLRKRLGQ